MSINQSFPWASTTPGQAGPYSDATYALWVQYAIQQWGNGVVRNALEEFEVLANSPAAANVVVQTGTALIQGRWAYNDADETLAIASNSSGNPRIDTIVIETNVTNQTMDLVVVQGSPAASPVPATLTQTATFWQHPLAYVTLASGFTTIAQTDITDGRTWCNTPDAVFLEINNQAASVLNKGNVVIKATSPTGYPIACNTTTSVANLNALGIIETRTLASGGTGRVMVKGVTPVLVNSALAVGATLHTTSTAGRLDSLPNGYGSPPVGVALQASSGAGQYILAYVDFTGAIFGPSLPASFDARGADQVLVANTATLMTFTTENYDYGGFYDAPNSRFTTLVKGIYQVNFWMTGIGVPFINMLAIYKNGAAQVQIGQFNISSNVYSNSISATMELNSGDYIEAYAAVNAGGTVTKTSNRAGFSAHLLTRTP